MRALVVVVVTSSCFAQATLPEIFRDHMVLQRRMPIPIWGKAEAGASISVTLDGAKAAGTAAADGSWRMELPGRKEGGPYVLTVSANGKITSFSDVMLGDVWLASGQSNMSMVMRPVLPYTYGVIDYEHEIASANLPNVRFFSVPEEGDYPEQTEMHGFWQVAIGQQVCNVSAISYYFARKLNQETGIPIGVIVAAVGSSGIGSWVEDSVNRKGHADQMEATDKLLRDHAAEVAEYDRMRPDFDKRAEDSRRSGCSGNPTPGHTQPFPNFLFKQSAMYNAMIAPLVKVPIKGVIWYQGEADARWYQNYNVRMADLIGSWRAHWNEPDMPFYFVQLAALAYDEREGRDFDPKELNFTNLREQQRIASLTIPHSGMAVIADLGDPMFVHPRNKKPAGERLALQALAHDYGMKIVYSGPEYQSMSRNGEKLVVKFDTQGSPLKTITGTNPYGFEIAGVDNVFHPAMSSVEGDTVVLSSPLVKDPKNVRYGWREYPQLSLYNAAGLPASPFTTLP
jgi:sialate O-acetylesterase